LKPYQLLSMSLVLTLGWMGLGFTPVTPNTTQAAEQKANTNSVVEHMQKIMINPTDGMIENTIDEWYEPISGSHRIDRHSFFLGAHVPFQRQIEHEGKRYEIKLEDGKLKGTSNSVTQYKNYKSSLFDFVSSEYKTEAWIPVGTIQLNGKKVNKLKNTTYNHPLSKIYIIAYVDASTGIPIKEEDYNGENKIISLRTFSFERVEDKKGEIFKDLAGVKIKDKEVSNNTIS